MKNIDIKKVKGLLKEIEISKRVISKERDKIRSIYSEVEYILESLDIGIESIQAGLDDLRSGIDDLSEYL